MIILEVKSGTGSCLAHKPDPMLILHGFSASETAGSASTAEIVVRRGTNSTGTMICPPINFASDGFGYPTFFPQPIPCYEGIFIDRVSGETTIVLYVDYQ
jgi:hypothetical protein